MKEFVAVVTGANRGIGWEICRQLAKLDYVVVLTSRDEAKGLEAVQEFNKKEELSVRYHPLDVTSPTQVLQLSDFLAKEFGRCDVLVNNAGIFLDKTGTFFDTDLTALRQTMETNLYGPFLLCQALVPLMKKNNYGRIINMSSGLGQLSDMGGNYSAYRISKTALNAITRILSNELMGTNILVNSMCPGWVRTELGGPDAPRSLEEGADTAVWLATLPEGGPTGKFFRDRKEIPW